MNRQSMNKLNLYFRAYLPSILWAILIFVLSSQSVLPSLKVSALDFFFKKSAHALVYGVLYILLHRAASQTLPKNRKTLHWMLPLTICLFYGISDELHQTFVPGRFATLRDLGYDMLGSSVALLKKYKYI